VISTGRMSSFSSIERIHDSGEIPPSHRALADVAAVGSTCDAIRGPWEWWRAVTEADPASDRSSATPGRFDHPEVIRSSTSTDEALRPVYKENGQ
jgi:hypothetical protein